MTAVLSAAQSLLIVMQAEGWAPGGPESAPSANFGRWYIKRAFSSQQGSYMTVRWSQWSVWRFEIRILGCDCAQSGGEGADTPMVV